MFSNPLSGPLWSQPPSSAGRTQRQRETIIPPQPAVAAPTAQPTLVHPATAAEFRQALDPILARLPLSLLRTFAEVGYCLHVIDSEGWHPLTVDVDPFPYQTLLSRIPQLLAQGGEDPLVEWGHLCDGGARNAEETEEWLGLIQWLNPDLSSEASVEETLLRLPGYRYWNGLKLPRETAEFLEHPGQLVGAEAGKVAGMVLHGALPGGHREENRILFWEFPFRAQDPLLDWYVLHELGHTTDYSFAFRRGNAWRQWQSRLEQAFERGAGLTDYAHTAPHEYFAEGFAAWATPPREGQQAGDSPLATQRLAVDAEALHQQDPWLEELIEEAVSALLTGS